MLNLTSPLTLNADTIKSPNLCHLFSKEDLAKIGGCVFDTYTADRNSRKDWERRMEAAMNLAMQVQEEKSFPWSGCSNVAFPLVTIAAMQFHARAYPAIINSRSVVQCRILGGDPQGVQKERAKRISTHMSWQLLEQDESWEEQMDRALLVTPILGCTFKKSYYDVGKGHNVSTMVLPQNLVVNYWARSIEDCPAKTHIIPMFRNELHERMASGTFYDCRDEAWYQTPPSNPTSNDQQEADNRKGQVPPEPDYYNTPFICLEQHCSLDLDGDGYSEPYIITIEETTQTVLRIVTRFDRLEDIDRNSKGEILRIRPVEYFTKIPFIPSPDGSIYDTGFGMLLGPLNESVNSAINQLFDAGTMANTAGGFLGRGAKIRGGVYEFSPFTWNRVDSTGDDLHKSIYPLPVREPSGVLFNLLTLLIEYTNRIAGSTDMMVGENPGQNTPAETARAMVEQGQKIYSAIFKRVWRGMKNEFKKLYQLNGVYLPIKLTFGDAELFVLREDYLEGGASVLPVADPTISSDGARFAKARMIREAALSAPGYDGDAVERQYLAALGVDEVDVLFPGAAGQEPAVDVKIQVQQMKLAQATAELEFKKMTFIMEMQEQQRLNAAKIVELNAKAMKLAEEARSEDGYKQIAALNTAISALKEGNTNLSSQIKGMMETLNGSPGQAGSGNGGGGAIQSVAGASGNEGLPPAAA